MLIRSRCVPSSVISFALRSGSVASPSGRTITSSHWSWNVDTRRLVCVPAELKLSSHLKPWTGKCRIARWTTVAQSRHWLRCRWIPSLVWFRWMTWKPASSDAWWPSMTSSSPTRKLCSRTTRPPRQCASSAPWTAYCLPRLPQAGQAGWSCVALVLHRRWHGCCGATWARRISWCLLTPQMLVNGACCGMCRWKHIVCRESRTSCCGSINWSQKPTNTRLRPGMDSNEASCNRHGDSARGRVDDWGWGVRGGPAMHAMELPCRAKIPCRC